MRSFVLGRRVLVGLLVVALGNPALAVTPTSQPPAASEQAPTGQPTQPLGKIAAADVVLTTDGLLVGQMVDRSGKPIGDAPIWLHTPAGEPVKAQTNGRGQFAYQGVRDGVCIVQAGEQVKLARVWAKHSAPPRVQSGLLMVADREVVRGQIGPNATANAIAGRTKRFFANPIALAATIGAAVAIPVAIHNSDSGS